MARTELGIVRREAVVSIASSRNVSYPALAEGVPGVDGPGDGGVYDMVRRAIGGAPNPLEHLVTAGKTVHVLPNFVCHRRPHERTADDFFAKVTHASVLHPVVDLALTAVGSAGRVSIGNAAIQGCDYARACREVGLDDLTRRLAAGGRHADVVDLRGLKTVWNAAGALQERTETGEELVQIDLGADSLLDALYARGSSPHFRVGDYAPAETESYHGRGRHVYVVNKRVLDADLIVSVPKLKTHEKVGMTCALKGTVGSIGRKECLAHHRRGGPSSGGDEFRSDNFSSRMASWLVETAARQPISVAGNVARILGKTAFRVLRSIDAGSVGGGWYGNDTAWRMALDIARIVLYGRPDGTMAPVPQRRHIAVVDGIISGEGDGPLRPSPRHSGVVIFGEDVCAVDWACALLMGFDPTALPITREAFSDMAYPLTSLRPADVSFVLDGAPITAAGVSRAISPRHTLPRGWRRRSGDNGRATTTEGASRVANL